VRSIARPGSLQSGGHRVAVTSVEVRQRVERPRSLVEVAGQQRAGVAAQQRVDPDGLVTAQVRDEHLVGQRQVVPRRATLRPTILRRRRPPGLSARRALPPTGVDIGAGAEQRPEQRELVAVRRLCIDRRDRRRRGQQRRRPRDGVSLGRSLVHPQQRSQPSVLLPQSLQLGGHVAGIRCLSHTPILCGRGHQVTAMRSGTGQPAGTARALPVVEPSRRDVS